MQPAKSNNQGNTADEIMRRTAAARRIREAQDLAELREIRAREAARRGPQDTPASDGRVH
jgi:hypothetical protein